MVLDALILIKATVDSSLTFPPLVSRRNLRLVRHEHQRRQLPRLHHCHAGPAGRDPHLPAPRFWPVVKDLVPDLTNFYAQYAS